MNKATTLVLASTLLGCAATPGLPLEGWVQQQVDAIPTCLVEYHQTNLLNLGINPWNFHSVRLVTGSDGVVYVMMIAACAQI